MICDHVQSDEENSYMKRRKFPSIFLLILSTIFERSVFYVFLAILLYRKKRSRVCFRRKRKWESLVYGKKIPGLCFISSRAAAETCGGLANSRPASVTFAKDNFLEVYKLAKVLINRSWLFYDVRSMDRGQFSSDVDELPTMRNRVDSRQIIPDDAQIMREYDMRAFEQTSSTESLDKMERECGGADRYSLLPRGTPCADIFGNDAIVGAAKFRKHFECNEDVEECDMSDTVDPCKPPGEGAEVMGHVSKRMRRNCFVRPSHLIMGVRRPKDAPIALTPGVRITGLLNRTEKVDKDVGATFDKYMVLDDTKGMLELGNDPGLAENMIQFVRMSDSERKRRVILEENQIAVEFMNLVGNTLGALPAMIDWILLQFCSRGSLFARILKFTPLYLACSNSTDEMHAGLLNSTGFTNPDELAAEVSYAKKALIAALAGSRDHAQKSLDDFMQAYMGSSEAVQANGQALGY
ncbi:unnamed protein product [Notodromas monacha]|uniref:Uncharacterized protein n=1 Tax=Notodromas monacha TaxID=399045 RepID=A0A7R9BUY0_9CRUS|nr:unnamed protein product [Notodromas monacha]CAG0921245.1 unnamed protein product [Notodromas monacha]